ISQPGRLSNSRNAARLRCPSWIFSASENCARTPPAAREVDPLASAARSKSTTSTPASARWNAALVPITPPPTITADADLGRGANCRAIVILPHWRGCRQATRPPRRRLAHRRCDAGVQLQQTLERWTVGASLVDSSHPAFGRDRELHASTRGGGLRQLSGPL